MRCFHVLLLVLLLPLLLPAQTNIDSLLQQLKVISQDTTKVMSLINVSNKYRVEKVDYANAKKYAQEALQLSSKIHFHKGRFKSTIAYAYAIRDMSKHHDAIEQLKMAINIYETTPTLIQDKSIHITHVYTYTALADLFTYLPDYANAKHYAFKALELSEKYDVGIGQCWITLSIILFKQKDILEAKKYALKAESYFKEKNALDDLARTYAYLARYAFTDKDYANAIRYYTLSYDNYKKVNSLIGMRIALYNLAEIYLNAKDFEKADQFINETVTVSKASSDDLVYQFYINQLKFDINLARKDYNTALNVGNKLLAIAINERNKEKITAAYKNLYAVYIDQKDTANAFIVAEKVSVLKDSLYNADMAKSIAELAKKYETEKKEQQIAFLDKENKLNRERLEQQTLLSTALKNENILNQQKLEQEKLLGDALERENQLKQLDIAKQKSINNSLQRENLLMQDKSRDEKVIRWLMIGLLLFAGIFTISYYTNYKNQQKSNQQISKQAEQLKVLMRELHHRVKNNFQVVVSMIRMQARGIDNKDALEALVNSENRLQAIAMVHEKLYRTDTLDKINLRNYLAELMEVLVKQHESKESICTYSVMAESNVITNLDVAIPLGLIVNELVTNSFKHGFTNVTDRHLAVAIKKVDYDNYQLLVTDNGVGLPNSAIIENTNTLGIKLVKLFAEQLNGRVEYNNKTQSCFTVYFRLPSST